MGWSPHGNGGKPVPNIWIRVAVGVATVAVGATSAGALSEGPGRATLRSSGPSRRNGRIVFVGGRFYGTPGIVSIGADGGARRSLTHRSDIQPVVSRDGRRVAFTRVPLSGGPDGIYVMNTDGSDQHLVVTGGSQPSWSPDGRRLAFVGRDGVAVVDLTTGKSKVLTPQTPAMPDWSNPIWSPDGRHIAARENDLLFVMRPDGSGLRALDAEPTIDVMTSFGWSPDGTRLVYTTAAGVIRVADVETGTFRMLVAPSSGFGALWSPDGKTIAYTAADHAGVLAVFLIPPSGGRPRELEPGWQVEAWSPDSRALAILYGNQIAVVYVRNGRRRWLAHEPRPSSIQPGSVDWGTGSRIFFAHQVSRVSQLISINADGTGARQLTHDQLGVLDPAWSPDGRSIAFTRLLGHDHSEVFVADADGHHARQLTIAPPGLDRYDSQPTWSPDGKQIGFLSSANGGEIDIVRVDGRGRREVAGVDASGLRWSPDGRDFAYSVDDPASDAGGRLVMVMPADGSADGHTIAKGTEPDWSPDGTRVVFVHVEPCGDNCDPVSSLHVVSSDGTNEQTVPGTDGLYAPHYSPDGRFVLAAGNDGIVILKPDGSRVRSIPLGSRLGPGSDQESWQPLRP